MSVIAKPLVDARVSHTRWPLSLAGLNRAKVIFAKQEWNRCNNPKATVDQPPRQRNASDLSCNNRERQNTNAGNQSESDNPLVSDRIAIGANKCDSDDQVRKRKPVSSVRQERVIAICGGHGISDSLYPREETSGFSKRSYGIVLQYAKQPCKLCLQSERSRSAQYQPHDYDEQV
jgi:hypothetical protein